MRRLHVAILDEELPYPLNSGKRIRTFNLLRRLAARHRLTYFCRPNADPDEARAAAVAFAECGIAVVPAGGPVPTKGGPGFPLRLAANLLSPLPYSVATHYSRCLHAAVARHAATGPVDLWHCEWTPYAEYARRGALPPAARWLVMAHNVESLIWQRYAETEPHPAKRWYVRQQWRKFERFERWAYSATTRTLAVSAADAGLIRTRFGGRDVAVVANGVDTAYFRPREGRRDPRRVLFLGSLDWRPNLDAVGWLLDGIWPRVRVQEPEARLCLVGRHPPDWLRRRAATEPGVELHADVADVRPFLVASGLLAVPLRVGGGSRLKILEALASGLPVVSTPVGREGLELTPGRHLFEANTEADFAATLAQGVRAPGRLRETAEEGRRRVVALYDWDALAERLEAEWLACARPGAGSRAA